MSLQTQQEASTWAWLSFVSAGTADGRNSEENRPRLAVLRPDPFPIYANMHAAGPVVLARVPLVGKAWIATTYDDKLSLSPWGDGTDREILWQRA